VSINSRRRHAAEIWDLVDYDRRPGSSSSDLGRLPAPRVALKLLVIAARRRHASSIEDALPQPAPSEAAGSYFYRGFVQGVPMFAVRVKGPAAENGRPPAALPHSSGDVEDLALGAASPVKPVDRDD
jgi:hypothetical protein